MNTKIHHKKARLDADKTSKPIMEIVAHTARKYEQGQSASLSEYRTFNYNEIDDLEIREAQYE